MIFRGVLRGQQLRKSRRVGSGWGSGIGGPFAFLLSPDLPTPILIVVIVMVVVVVVIVIVACVLQQPQIEGVCASMAKEHNKNGQPASVT